MTWICVSELNTWGADIQKCVIVTLIVSKPAIYTYTTLNRLTRGWFKSTVKPRQIWKLFLKRTALSRWATLGVISPNVHTYSLCVCVCACAPVNMCVYYLHYDLISTPKWFLFFAPFDPKWNVIAYYYFRWTWNISVENFINVLLWFYQSIITMIVPVSIITILLLLFWWFEV